MVVKKKVKDDGTLPRRRIPKSLDIGSIYKCKDKDNEVYYSICLDIKKPRDESNDYYYFGFTSKISSNNIDDSKCILNYYDEFKIYYTAENLLEFEQLKSPRFLKSILNFPERTTVNLSQIYDHIREFKYNDLMKSIKESEVNNVPYVDVVYDFYQDDDKPSCSVVYSYYNTSSTLRGHLIVDNYIECCNFELKTVLKSFKQGKYKVRGYLSYSQHEELLSSCFTGTGRFLNKEWFNELKKFEN